MRRRRQPPGHSPDHPATTDRKLWMVCRDKGGYEAGVAYWNDGSAQCHWFHALKGLRGLDWGVCTKPHAPRAGLLTFEPMGCQLYEFQCHPTGINPQDDRETGRRR
jgi:hypothetical protein